MNWNYLFEVLLQVFFYCVFFNRKQLLQKRRYHTVTIPGSLISGLAKNLLHYRIEQLGNDVGVVLSIGLHDLLAEDLFVLLVEVLHDHAAYSLGEYVRGVIRLCSAVVDQVRHKRQHEFRLRALRHANMKQIKHSAFE
jgi:hypothetical protein